MPLTVGPEIAGPGTFHVPSACHPELPPSRSRAARYITLLPAKLTPKLRFNVKVKVLPLPDARDPAPLTVHWLLPVLPEPLRTNSGSNAVPVSFTRYRTPAERL